MARWQSRGEAKSLSLLGLCGGALRGVAALDGAGSGNPEPVKFMYRDGFGPETLPGVVGLK